LWSGPTGYACHLHSAARSALGMGLQALTRLIQQRLIIEIDALRDRAQLVVLPPPCALDVTPADFSHAGELIERALRDARAFLAEAPGQSAVPPVMRSMDLHNAA
jgi:NTE family protein